MNCGEMVVSKSLVKLFSATDDDASGTETRDADVVGFEKQGGWEWSDCCIAIIIGEWE